MLAEFCQSGPVIVLTTRRPLSLFIGFLPALHLTGLSPCKIRKNSSGITSVSEGLDSPSVPLHLLERRKGI